MIGELHERRARAQATVDLLPVAALITAPEGCLAVNESYLELMGLRPEAVVGQPVSALIVDRIASGDRALVAQAGSRSTIDGRGHLWCRVRDAVGRERAVRVIWRRGPEPDQVLTVLLDAEPEAFGRDVADALARAAGLLGSCANENEVLERATEALSARGLTATVLLIDEGSPLLRYGPTRSPVVIPESERPRFRAHAPPRAILEQFNPGFSQRRAAFFQDGMRLIGDAYPEPLAAELAAVLPSQRMVQAPLFVDRQPYGAIVVTGELLTPLLAGAIELYAELVARAIENVRLRGARVERERLAALGEAAAVMAHEVRNPIGALLNAAAILVRTPDDTEVRGQMIDIIAEEAERLERIVEELLALGRPLAPRRMPVPLEELREAALALLGRRGELGAVRVERHDRDGRVLADADPDLLQLALFNVVRNAVQSSPSGARLRISTIREGDACALVVEDEGPGFSPEAARRLSEPFFTTRAAGTGMGLALVRRVLDAHGGRLDVKRSDDLGGARVELWIAAARADGAPAG